MNRFRFIIGRIHEAIVACIARSKIIYNKTGKIALCCIVKCENDYIKEFIDYYKQLKVDKIFLFDNNDLNGEKLEDIIHEDIVSGFCEIINYRGKKVCQLKAYQECYDKYNKEFDWIAFFDCDEYLFFPQSYSIKEYLYQQKFSKYQLIHINWMNFGDNELIENDGRLLNERFTKPILPLNYKSHKAFPENNHIKTIVRGNLSDINWTCTPHTPISKYYLCCNSLGEKCDGNSPFAPFNHSTAYIKHFYTKTITEWITIKKKRGYPDQTIDLSEKKLGVDEFFSVNKRTQQKNKVVILYSNKS